MKNTSELNNPLCPVRCLEFYAKKLKELKVFPTSLFVSPSDTSRELSKNAISYFLRDTILSAKAVYEDGGPVKAHDIRGVAATMAFKLNASISDIMNAAMWKSLSTFANFYSKDIAYSSKGWKALESLVAAGSIVN